jgi:hypothetical protein
VDPTLNLSARRSVVADLSSHFLVIRKYAAEERTDIAVVLYQLIYMQGRGCFPFSSFYFMLFHFSLLDQTRFWIGLQGDCCHDV